MKWFKRIVLILLAIILVTGIVFTVQGYLFYREQSSDENITAKIKEIQESENYVTLEELPQSYLNAVVAVEDHRFYNHGAIDIIAIGRAIVTNIKNFDFVEGGSTITQQIAKNIFFTQDESMVRKIAEIFMAFKLESMYDKDEILEIYVNNSYFGYGYTGIKEACNGYLGKDPMEMTLYDASLLAGVPNSPYYYSPRSNIDLATKRQQKVLSSMVKYNYISQEEADEALNTPSPIVE